MLENERYCHCLPCDGGINRWLFVWYQVNDTVVSQNNGNVLVKPHLRGTVTVVKIVRGDCTVTVLKKCVVTVCTAR